MSNSTFNPRSLGALQPFVNNNPTTIVSSRSPAATDRAAIGQLWINQSNNTSYFLTSIASGNSVWTANAGGGGGSGVFTDVTITGPGGTTLDVQMGDVSIDAGSLSIPAGGLNVVGVSSLADMSVSGAASFTGDFDVNIPNSTTITSSEASFQAITLFASDNAGGIQILAKGGGVTLNADDGPIDITGATGDINIGNDSDAKDIFIGNNTASTSVTISAGTGVTGLNLDGHGNVQVVPATSSAASPSSSVTINQRVGVATFTGFTTATSGTIILDLTNSKITTQSGIIASVYNLNASTNNAGMAIKSIVVAAGSALITVVNNGSGALGAGDNVLLTFWVIS